MEMEQSSLKFHQDLPLRHRTVLFRSVKKRWRRLTDSRKFPIDSSYIYIYSPLLGFARPRRTAWTRGEVTVLTSIPSSTFSPRHDNCPFLFIKLRIHYYYYYYFLLVTSGACPAEVSRGKLAATLLLNANTTLSHSEAPCHLFVFNPHYIRSTIIPVLSLKPCGCSNSFIEGLEVGYACSDPLCSLPPLTFLHFYCFSFQSSVYCRMRPPTVHGRRSKNPSKSASPSQCSRHH